MQGMEASLISANRKFKIVQSVGSNVYRVLGLERLLAVRFLDNWSNNECSCVRYSTGTLRAAIKRCHPGLLTKCVLLLQDNARHHSNDSIRELEQTFQWKNVDHPPYSPILVPRVLFGFFFHTSSQFSRNILMATSLRVTRMSKQRWHGGFVSRILQFTIWAWKNSSYA